MTEEAICKWLPGDDWQWKGEWAKVQPLIRCKDCKHMGDVYLVSLPWLEQKEHRCRYWEHPTTPDEYCSRAKRREE